MRRTVNVPVIVIAALAVVFVLALMAAMSPGPTRPDRTGGPTGAGGLIDRVLPGGAPLFERAPAPPHAR